MKITIDISGVDKNLPFKPKKPVMFFAIWQVCPRLKLRFQKNVGTWKEVKQFVRSHRW